MASRLSEDSGQSVRGKSVTNKKRLLILNRDQFGYHLGGTYQYCKYASDKYDIVYCGFDAGLPKISVPDVYCLYVSSQGNIVIRYLRLMRSFLGECKGNYDVIFIKYFMGCSILRLVHSSKRFVMDVRTCSVLKNPVRRWWMDLILRFESLCFKHISVISQSLAYKLRLPTHKVYILPLGGDPVKVQNKVFDSFHLLYVGTLYNRRIEDTIRGFARFYNEYKVSAEITYNIIGDGPNGELDILRKVVDELRLRHIIKLPGYIHQSQLYQYYECSNLGVSYIPINKRYDCQPPTKTFEYLLAGMPVIATSTLENSRVVSGKNGILIRDNADAFYEGLKALFHKRLTFCSEHIYQDNQRYSWQNIIVNYFIPLIQKVAIERCR